MRFRYIRRLLGLKPQVVLGNYLDIFIRIHVPISQLPYVVCSFQRAQAAPSSSTASAFVNVTLSTASQTEEKREKKKRCETMRTLLAEHFDEARRRVAAMAPRAIVFYITSATNDGLADSLNDDYRQCTTQDLKAKMDRTDSLEEESERLRIEISELEKYKKLIDELRKELTKVSQMENSA
jgi:hypothetical protein